VPAWVASQVAVAELNESRAKLTEAELKARLGRDPQMDKQTGVLQDISNKLTVRPVNPNLSGRP
jgi:hypothetical protein